MTRIGRMRSRFGAATAVVALVLSAPAFAAGGKPEAVSAAKSRPRAEHTTPGPAADPLARQQGERALLAHKMMGHVSLAALALDSQLPEAAVDHIATARKLARQLDRAAPRVESETTLEYGKLSYSLEDEQKDYYVPILDDVFLLSDYHQTYHAFRKSALEEQEAGVVRVTIRADLRAIEQALDSASKALAARHPGEAAEDLRAAFKGALVDEEVVTDPTWAIYDNLALARNMIGEHHYHGARLVLDHAQKRLDELEKAHGRESEKAEFRDMHAEIASLSNRLETEDPTLLESADHLVHGWMTRVRGWFAPSA